MISCALVVASVEVMVVVIVVIMVSAALVNMTEETIAVLAIVSDVISVEYGCAVGTLDEIEDVIDLTVVTSLLGFVTVVTCALNEFAVVAATEFICVVCLTNAVYPASYDALDVASTSIPVTVGDTVVILGVTASVFVISALIIVSVVISSRRVLVMVVGLTIIVTVVFSDDAEPILLALDATSVVDMATVVVSNTALLDIAVVVMDVTVELAIVVVSNVDVAPFVVGASGVLDIAFVVIGVTVEPAVVVVGNVDGTPIVVAAAVEEAPVVIGVFVVAGSVPCSVVTRVEVCSETDTSRDRHEEDWLRVKMSCVRALVSSAMFTDDRKGTGTMHGVWRRSRDRFVTHRCS